MTTRRPVADRLKNLAYDAPKSNMTLNGAKMMMGGLKDSEDITCTVNRHCRTRVFDFPRALPTEPIPSHSIYDSDPVRASLVCGLVRHFLGSASTHYAISPPLRHEIGQKQDELAAQNNRRTAFLVIEELTELTPMTFDKECVLVDEVSYVNGERTPLLNGGRDNEKFILAMRTIDGQWPSIPSNEPTVNMILAAIRASQDTHDEIRKHVDQSCLVTDDGRFVATWAGGFMPVRASVASDVDAREFQSTADRLRSAIPRIEADMQQEHIELLVNAVYWDDYKDDDFRRLHYLNLWQSLTESKRILGYIGPGGDNYLKNDRTIVAGKTSLADLTEYRDDIAHWWTESIDSNYLADMYRTINELMRRKYFK
ncbi:MAG: hypothetical protein OXU42_12995 [Deltaproteobacteria bacterium]|nr:hypothetical protein [Deltaproteobacteria bacterium]